MALLGSAMNLRAFSLLFFLVASLIGWAPAAMARAALTPAMTGPQLVMMEEAGCTWCERWFAEIGGVYHLTPEGRRAPLRRVDVHEPLPADLSYLKLAYFTPTFILVSDGREIGRIKGYPGEDFFWMLLNELLARLDVHDPREAEVTP